MRIMGIDLGARRTGIAVSDLGGTIAGDAFIIEEYNAERLLKKIAQEAENRGVGEIVLGMPKNMNASVGEKGLLSVSFAEKLKAATNLPVCLWDERKTTFEAHRILRESGKKEIKHKKLVDAVAASIILQNYLDFKNRKL